MPYDERLAGRVRAVMANADGVRERKMFGGLAFLLNGNMCCGVVRNDLMVRVGPDDYEQSLQRAHARAMDFTGKPMKGFVYVSPAMCPPLVWRRRRISVAGCHVGSTLLARCPPSDPVRGPTETEALRYQFGLVAFDGMASQLPPEPSHEAHHA